nr:hypothetical protein GCM10020093_059490 [Planobispora longispora]
MTTGLALDSPPPSPRRRPRRRCCAAPSGRWPGRAGRSGTPGRTSSCAWRATCSGRGRTAGSRCASRASPSGWRTAAGGRSPPTTSSGSWKASWAAATRSSRPRSGRAGRSWRRCCGPGGRPPLRRTRGWRPSRRWSSGTRSTPARRPAAAAAPARDTPRNRPGEGPWRRGGGGADWLRYAPEAHARFPLRLLGVRRDLLAEQGDTAALDGLGAPLGYAPLPVHPWQFDLLAAELAAPLADGRLIDLGYGSRPAIPTSSVRTVYEPSIDRCLKFSLDVRITNCVRKNSWYELAGAVELTSRLDPVFRRLAAEFPGTRWLPEPGYRSADLGVRLMEGLGVIIRVSPWSVCRPGVTPC